MQTFIFNVNFSPSTVVLDMHAQWQNVHISTY